MGVKCLVKPLWQKKRCSSSRFSGGYDLTMCIQDFSDDFVVRFVLTAIITWPWLRNTQCDCPFRLADQTKTHRPRQDGGSSCMDRRCTVWLGRHGRNIILIDNWSRQLHPILIVLSNNAHTAERGNKHAGIVMIQNRHTFSNIKNNSFAYSQKFPSRFLYQPNTATAAWF